MENQFCKKCGQANFPNATSCSKCGQVLNAPSFGSDTPRGFSSEQKPAQKKSNTKYWIIGGILAVFLIIAVFGIIAGAGLLVYLNSSNEVTRDYPAPESSPTKDRRDDSTPVPPKKSDSDNPLDDVTFPTGNDVTFGDETSTTMNDKILLNFFLKQKKVVGRFKLVNVKTSTSREFFPNRSAGVQAEYKNGRKRLLHRVAIYKSIGDARSDIATYKRNVKNSGARIRSSTQTRLIFVLKGFVYLAFYTPQGGLHEMSARNGNDITQYFNAYSRAGK